MDSVLLFSDTLSFLSFSPVDISGSSFAVSALSFTDSVTSSSSSSLSGSVSVMTSPTLRPISSTSKLSITHSPFLVAYLPSFRYSRLISPGFEKTDTTRFPSRRSTCLEPSAYATPSYEDTFKRSSSIKPRVESIRISISFLSL